ncbi:hypothetical protein PUR34_40915 [Streptomyces sp. JV185]|uniref:thioesterase II family protein n=1 Tax=Streptomyces sp. JV185 TaxID=858638 RepID=UPI002E75ED7C|nr:hypothetical protein [Streptomyces sp. JV185]MEE1774367.1 hypothetical protein [Streptomyces sp. JV185]
MANASMPNRQLRLIRCRTGVTTLQLAFPVISGDLRVVEKYGYTAGAPLTCPLIVTGGNRDPSVAPADLELWKDYAIRGAEVHMVDGGHFYFDESLPRVIGILAALLARLPLQRVQFGQDGEFWTMSPPGFRGRPPATPRGWLPDAPGPSRPLLMPGLAPANI